MINHFGFYMIRRPSRSLESLTKLHQQLSASSLEATIKECFQRDADLREAILVASPHLTQRLNQWLSGEDVSEKNQLIFTLYKYLIRSATRCTPFGLFSCTAIGQLAGETQIAFDSSRTRTNLSIDIELLSSLSYKLLTMPAIRDQLILYPNTSLYDAGHKYHYVERVINGNQSKYFISGVEKSDALELALAYAENGITFKTLAGVLTGRGNSVPETIGFVSLLMENQILEAEIRPKVTGTDSLSHIIGKLSLMRSTEDIVIRLEDLRQSLQQNRNTADTHEIIAQNMAEMGITSAKPHVIKADTFFDLTENKLSENVVNDIAGTLSRLMVFNQERLSTDFKEFREHLLRRYAEREVPLAMALDDDLGVGYGNALTIGGAYSPMLEELELTPDNSTDSRRDAFWQQFILDKYLEALGSGKWRTQLTDQDIDLLNEQKKKPNQVRRAGTFFLFGNLLSKSQSALDAGEYQFNLLACQGSSAVNMMSRFAGGIPGLEEQLRACAASEQQMHPDVIFAEIVHFPEDHAGNIMTRPVLYPYEIPFMGQSDLPCENRIPISDLMVSVRNGEIVLRSKRLNKRVIPRLSNMHNYSKGLPMYRFLADLQDQDANLSLHWDWDVLKKQPHLPRVTYKNFILCRETWRFQNGAADLKNVAQLKSYLQSAGAPRYLAVASGDNELMIDMEVPTSMQLLLDTIRKSDTVRVMEYLGYAQNCLLQASDEHYFSEFIFPMRETETVPYRGHSLPAYRMPQENFGVGAEWLYLKIYTDEKSNHSRIIPAVQGAVKRLMDSRIIELFFFVRYFDSDPHLRLRFKGNPDSRFYVCVLDAIHTALAAHTESGLVYNVQTDTYQRELDRYGHRHIALCERIFHFDSLSTMQFLSGRSVDENERFIYAIRKMDRLLGQADWLLEQRKSFTDNLRESFFQEFKGDKALRKKLNARYQLVKDDIAHALEKPLPDDGQAAVMQAILRRSPDDTTLARLVSSLIHMMVNRVFTARQRAYEMMLYHCLFKHYDASLARKKSAKTSGALFIAH